MSKIDKRQQPGVQQELHIQEELESIADNLSIDGDFDDLFPTDDAIPEKPTNFMDFNAIKIEVNTAADSIVESIVSYYINTKVKFQNEDSKRYIQNRISTDKLTVSNLLFQMKTAEHAIIKLLEEIDSGNMHPRQFEVLASLQKSKMEIVKHLVFVQQQLESNYKQIRQEYAALHEADDDDMVVKGSIGTKGLLQELKSNINNDKYKIFDDDDE